MPTINVVPTSTAELQQIADTLAKSRKIVVVTGAGISTNCGIPDFRSEHGLYSMIQAQYDAALENPPWEMNDYDIDDRPKKKRRVTERHYYELVTADGVRVELPPEESSELPSAQPSEQPSQKCSRLPSKEPSLQPEAAPTSSRRSSRRHVSLAQDNTKHESPNPILKGKTAQAEHASLMKDNSANGSTKANSRRQITRARNVSLAQGDSINETPKPPSKRQSTRARNTWNTPLKQDDRKIELPKSSWKSPLPRARPTLACDRCRILKIKCGEIRPCCKSCSKAGAECITTENPKRRESRNVDAESREEIAPALEMDIDSESFNVEEKASQQLLQESNEYSSQYSSEKSRLPEDADAIDSKPQRARLSLRSNAPSSTTTKIQLDSSQSKPLRRERSTRSSTIQASVTNQQSTSKPRSLDERSSSQIRSPANSIIKGRRSSSRQSTRPRAGSLPAQLTQQNSSLVQSSSRRNTPAFELSSNKLSSATNIESTSTTGSSTPSISSSDCSSSNKRNFSSEVGSTTTASESEEPSTLSSQSSSSRTLPNLKGKDLFDSVIWSDPFSTSIFYMFISNFRRRIYNNVKSTTTTHKFIRALRDNGRLVRNYTQNIDCLEEREGLTTDLELGAGDRTRFQAKVQGKSVPSGGEGRGGKETPVGTGVECVLLHGSLRKLRCGVCSKLTSWDEDDRESTTMAGSAPDCPSCISSSLSRQDKGRRGLAVGRLRPDIVLYGEEHPHANLVGPLIIHDLKLGPDVLLILGTSLRVHGLKIMIKEFAQAVHARGGSVIFVNQTKPPESQWGDVIDYWVEWDCDAWVMDLKNRRSDIWQPYSNVTQIVAIKDPPPSKQRNSSEKILPFRPQCKRDDKTNAVHFTFKILDDLRKLKDPEGNGSVRPIYWQPFDRKALRTSTGEIPEDSSVKKPQSSILPIRRYRKSLPASSNIKPLTVATNSKSERRQTIPGNTPVVNTPSTEPPRSGAWLGDRILKDVRRLTNNTLPESLFVDLRARVSLERLADTVPGNSIGYKRSFGDVGIDGGLEVIGLPNIRGLMDSTKISIKGMSLASLPPTGSLESGGEGKGKGKLSESGERASSPLDQNPMVVEPRPVTRHSYGTRSKRTSRVGGEEEESGDGGAGDTIIVRRRDRMRIGAVCNDR
ncbi:hypothetical protein DSL72_004670 [Monilinia vaccinii-corymbosi]|uniref:Zn(2)-C6 fungal-type domain-containing protein n=1 Tax=Monilinia vaccinii-corymbosi TaxID=61207 RepID=A0A8A3P138_9HELO|nr:hypothetical protein DSL72_004670 [Monilinia vaccinii-corymbosi]